MERVGVVTMAEKSHHFWGRWGWWKVITF